MTVSDAPGSPYAPPGTAQEISDGIFAYVQPDGTWWINNTGFLVGSRGVVSVDACATERRTRTYLETIARVTDQPVRTLLNTHHHGDHTYGNYLFSGATIVAHERARAAMAAWGGPGAAPYWNEIEWGHIEISPPFLTFRDEITVYVDDLACQVRHLGPAAHTDNDSVVWIPERGVLFSGDLLFNGGTPFLLQGSLSGSLEVMRSLRSLGATTIVPGHGEVCGPEVIDTVEGYLEFVRDLAREGHAAGVAPLELARASDLGGYAELHDSERIVGNLYRAYAELDGAAPGAPLDAGAVLTDMVAYNGGLLTCHA